MKMTRINATALCLTAVVSMSASTVNALEVCEDCVVVESTEKHNNVPFERSRKQTVMCPVGHFLTDVECKKDNNNFRFQFDGTSHVFREVGNSFQVGAACTARASKVRRDVTVTVRASCQPPQSAGQVVFSREKKNQVPSLGFRRHSVNCPAGTIMTRPFCYRSSDKFTSTAKNARFTNVEKIADAGSAFLVRAIPTGVRCGVRAGPPRIDTTITAMATCVDIDDPEVMLETAEIVSNTTEEEKRFTHEASASCPDGKKLVAHRCGNSSNRNSQESFTESEAGASCSFGINKVISRGGSKDSVTAKLFCVDEQSGL